MLLKIKLKGYYLKLALVVWLWVGLCAAVTQAQTVPIITQIEQMQLIGKEVLFFEDTTAQLSLDAIRHPRIQRQFQLIKKNIFNRHANHSVFWFKIRIQNQTKQVLWLETGDSFASCIDFYAPGAKNNYNTPIKLGVVRPQTNKLIKSNFYYVPLSASDSTKTYYLRKTGDFTHYHIFQVGTREAVRQHLKTYDYMLAGFIGIMLAMTLYNLMLLYSTKDKIYLIYVAYLVYSLFNVPFNNGYTLFYGSFWWEYFYVWSNPVFVLTTLFAIYYLKLPRFAPNLTLWIIGLTILLSGVFPVLNLLHYPHFTLLMIPYQLSVVVYMITLLLAGVYVWFKGRKTARFYVLGWFFVIVSVVVHVLALEGLLLFHHLFHHSLYIGISLETLLFALALGDRWNVLKKEKEKIQAENLLLVGRQNDLLAQKVNEKTRELQMAYEEVQTNNEALKMAQEEVASHNDLLANQNNKLTLYRTRIGQSFRAAQMIQAALLPSHSSMQRAFANHFVLNMPKDVVSGDFYWLYTHQQTKVLVVADCTGHGVPGAFMTFIGNNLLNKIVKIKGITQPNIILELLNQEVQTVFKQQGSTKGYEGGMDAAILVFNSLSDQLSQLSFAGAKANLWYTSPAHNTLQEVIGTRRSVGGFQPKGNKPYQAHQVELPTGSILYMGSDGLVDQNNEQRRKFGSMYLKEVLQQNTHLPLPQQKQALEQTLKLHMQDCEQRDDIMWLGIQV